MSTNFPGTLDAAGPTAADLANDSLATKPHSTLHGDLELKVSALEAKVGADSSAVTTSLDYKVAHLPAADVTVADSLGWFDSTSAEGALAEARAAAASGPLPVTSGLLAWAYDPVGASGTKTPAAARIYLHKILVPEDLLFTNLLVYVTTAGTAYSNAQVGIYASDGTFLRASAVMASAGTDTFGTTGAKAVPLSSAVTVTGGPGVFVWGALHMGVNSATAAVFAGLAVNAINAANGVLAASVTRFGSHAGHATDDLATVGNLTPATISQASISGVCWMGVT